MAVFVPRETILVQTRGEPMTVLRAVKDHAVAVGRCVAWERVGILFDDGPAAVLTVLIHGSAVVCAVRFCLSVSDSVEAIRAYRSKAYGLEIRRYHERTIEKRQLVDLSALGDVWRRSESQGAQASIEDVEQFFVLMEATARKRAERSIGVSWDNRTQVMMDAHGRCMFGGCGSELAWDDTFEPRKYVKGSESVRPSQGRPRGVLHLFESICDEPHKMLLLCELHYRVVDLVGKADYPVWKLAEMRERYHRDVSRLLEGLQRTAIPAYFWMWPVHQQVISPPSETEIAEALAPMGARLDGELTVVGDHYKALQTTGEDCLWDIMPDIVERSADSIVTQAKSRGYRAALFAMGLMPSLIALGAKLGNKCEIIPILRHRESGRWQWPATEPRRDWFSVKGLTGLSRNEADVVLRLALTAAPGAMDATAKSLGYAVVSVVAHRGLVGNGCLGHPSDGCAFRQRMQELFHEMRDVHGVRRVHVLPCASNAACVFFGQAFDSYHPELVLYDFAGDGDRMVSRLRVWNEDDGCSIEVFTGDH